MASPSESNGFFNGVRRSVQSLIETSGSKSMESSAEVVRSSSTGKMTDKTRRSNSEEPPDESTFQRIGEVGELSSEFIRWRREFRNRNHGPTNKAANLMSDLNRQYVGKIILAQLSLLLKTYGDKKSRHHFSRTLPGVPDGLKSTKWPHQENSKTCYHCNKPFGGLMNHKIHCRLCGFIHCNRHAQKQFIIFLDREGQAQWCIPGVNDPVVEPSAYTHVITCDRCVERLKPHAPDHSVPQVATIGECPEPRSEEDLLSENLTAFHEKFSKNQSIVSICLQRYKELLDECEEVKRRGETPSSVVKEDISRLHCNLEDSFKVLADLTLRLKHFDGGKTVRQQKITNNLYHSCQTFHSIHIKQFRENQVHVVKFLPKVNHKSVLKSKSLSALEMVYVVVQQLTFELISLTDGYPNLTDVLKHIKGIEEIVREELDEVLMIEGESSEEHLAKSSNFVKMEMKAGRLHIPKPDSYTASYPNIMRGHVLKFCMAQLNKCNRHIASSTTIDGCEQTRRIIGAKLLLFSSDMQSI